MSVPRIDFRQQQLAVSINIVKNFNCNFKLQDSLKIL